MTSAVTITFTSCTFSAVNSTIEIGDGGSLSLGSQNQIALNGVFTFTNLIIVPNLITFTNTTGPGAAVSGTLVIPISPPSHGVASIQVNAFNGSATATWGVEGFAQLTSGEKAYLNGLT